VSIYNVNGLGHEFQSDYWLKNLGNKQINLCSYIKNPTYRLHTPKKLKTKKKFHRKSTSFIIFRVKLMTFQTPQNKDKKKPVPLISNQLHSQKVFMRSSLGAVKNDGNVEG
jgi:hypothetical protein